MFTPVFVISDVTTACVARAGVQDPPPPGERWMYITSTGVCFRVRSCTHRIRQKINYPINFSDDTTTSIQKKNFKIEELHIEKLHNGSTFRSGIFFSLGQVFQIEVPFEGKPNVWPHCPPETSV